MKDAIRLTVATVGLLTTMTAQAQICTTTCSRYESGQCVEHTHFCQNIPSAPADSYGAIAYSRTSGAWGNSYKWGSRAKAESAAMGNCGQHAKDCQVTVWY